MIRYNDDYRIDYLKQFYTKDQINRYCNGKEEKLEELYQDTQPQEISIEDLADINNGERYLSDSPDGWVPVEMWRNKGVKAVLTLELEGGLAVTASIDHLFQQSDQSWKQADNLVIGDDLLTVGGSKKILAVTTAGNQTVYDLAIDHKNHRYFTNDICSHNSGKSLVLQNLALNWVLQGYNGVYFTLELHEDHTALKLDAMLTGRGTRDIVREISDSALLVAVRGKKAGNLRIKKYPEGGTNCNDLRAYLKEYEIVNGYAPDFILIDYLDLLFPNDKRIDPSNLFIKDKFVSEEIRALMHETNTFGATASQLTRNSLEVMGEFDQSHTAGGISKINTADNAIALYAPPSHKERGEFDMVFLKTRASAGVGQRIKLGYDNTCMRITDPTLTFGDVDKGASYDDLRQELRAAKPIAVTTIPETTDKKLSKLDELMAKRRS